MPQSGLPLADIFQQVAKTLVENQQGLNQADEINKDHGDNMVQTFQTIARSLQEKHGASDSDALAFAAKKLSQSTSSGSGQLYAKGLSQAAAQFEGKEVDTRSAMQLLQTLIGGGQAPAQSAGGDLLTTLMGSMAGGETAQPQQTSQAGGDDLLGTLLGGLAGGTQAAQPQQAPQAGSDDLFGALLGSLGGNQTAQPQQAPQAGGDMLDALLGGLAGGNTSSNTENNGLDMGDLLNAGMAFMQAKQSGGSNLQALIQAFMAASGMGGSAHRAQSTQLVVSSFLKALGAGG